MGKNSSIKSLGKRIGNIVLHNLLVKYTNRPESKSYMQNEVIEYRNAAIKDAKEYHWNESDKNQLRKVAIDFIKQKKEIKYSDVSFSLKEAKKLIDEEIVNLDL